MGYPLQYNGLLMQSGTGTILDVSTYRLFYNVDTTTGQSGSGIFFGNYNNGQIVGIHTSNVSTTQNAGIRITSGLLSLIQSNMNN